MSAILELSFECKEESLSVRRFSVREAMNGLFEVTIVARSPNEDIDLEAMVGRPAGFLMRANTLLPRVWTGIASHVEQVGVEQPGPGAMGLSTYLVRIVPSMWLLGQRRENRVFQHQTVPQIVQKVLAEYGVESTLALSEPHREHEYRVQYGETDFAFVSRLLEEEGISYFFGQKKGDKGLHSELVLSDRPTTGEARGVLKYADHPNEALDHEYVTRVTVAQGTRPGRFTIRDYDFKRPDYALVGNADKAKAPEEALEQYVYEHGAFEKDPDGKQRADIALQAQRRTRRQIAFVSNVHDLGPGVLVAIGGHPRKDLAPDKRLLLVEVTHEGTSQGHWTVGAVAVFAALPYRPAQTTPRPRIPGVQSAVVVGPKGEEIHTDELGRVRVQFHWDRDGKHDEKSSCWVRVSQGWAGAAYGMMTIPRIGQEVLVGFWEGNPDEPLVVGRVYNNKNPVPYKLPAEKTKSTWKSDTSPHNGGFNEILFEDKSGAELVYIQAQRDLSKLVKRDETERTGKNRTVVVGGNRSAVVGADDTTLVGAKYSVAIVEPKELAILKLGAPEVTPTTTLMEMEDGRIVLTTGKASVVLDGADITLKADGDIAIKAGGEVVIQGGPFVKINC